MQKLDIVLKLTLISAVIGMAGCSSKDEILPTPDQDMEAVYNGHMNSVGSGLIYDTRSINRRPMLDGDVELSDYVRTEKNQLEARFKMIPNPTMYMFVAPHLASESKVPIPGYITEFKMWEKDHYALPGEISDMSSKYRHVDKGE